MNPFNFCETFDIIICINLHRSLSCVLFSVFIKSQYFIVCSFKVIWFNELSSFNTEMLTTLQIVILITDIIKTELAFSFWKQNSGPTTSLNRKFVISGPKSQQWFRHIIWEKLKIFALFEIYFKKRKLQPLLEDEFSKVNHFWIYRALSFCFSASLNQL